VVIVGASIAKRLQSLLVTVRSRTAVVAGRHTQRVWSRVSWQPFWIRDGLKRRLAPMSRRRLRRLSRLRWITKARLVRRHQFDWRERPLRAARFVLLDPEVESFTYELANRAELLDFAADVLGHDRMAIARHAAEVDEDRELLRFPRRWQHKRRLPLANRLFAYVAVRALKPELVVETGIHDGLGSLVILRALERNAEDGRPGLLISFDINADTGWLVPEHLRTRWQRVCGSTLSELEPALTGRSVDMSVHDASSQRSVQQVEFEAVLRHRADSLVVVNCAGPDNPVLARLCAREDGRERRFQSQSLDHIYPGNLIAVATFPGDGRAESDA
jgi:hypothetical protein